MLVNANIGWLSVAEVISAIRSIDPSRFSGAVGASQEQINALALRWRERRLPGAYAEFLTLLGNSSGNVVLHESLDFSLPTVIDGFDNLDSPIGALLPIAFDDTTELETILCLDLESPPIPDDPGLYGVVSLQEPKVLDLHWAEHFSLWVGRLLFIGALVKTSKYTVSIQPDLNEAFYLWSGSHDVDRLIRAALSEVGLTALLPQCGIYHAAESQFVVYERYPKRSGFFLRIGSRDPSLSRRLRTTLSLLTGTAFTEDGF